MNECFYRRFGIKQLLYGCRLQICTTAIKHIIIVRYVPFPWFRWTFQENWPTAVFNLNSVFACSKNRMQPTNFKNKAINNTFFLRLCFCFIHFVSVFWCVSQFFFSFRFESSIFSGQKEHAAHRSSTSIPTFSLYGTFCSDGSTQNMLRCERNVRMNEQPNTAIKQITHFIYRQNIRQRNLPECVFFIYK